MLTIRAEIKKGEMRSDETFNVKIRFTLNRQVKRLSTSIFARKEELTKLLTLKEGTDVKKQVDELVLSYKRRCAELQTDINHYTLTEILDLLDRDTRKKQKIDFIDFAQDWIENTNIKGKKNYKSAVNAFIDYLGSEHLDIKDLTKDKLQGFLLYLDNKKELKNKKLAKKGDRIPSNRASSLYLGSIRHLFREAKLKYNDYDRDILCITHDPFMGFSVPKQEATRKRALGMELIRRIHSLPYKTNKGQIYHCRYNLAKDCFILSFCLLGMNSADLFQAALFEGDTITYFREKTKGRRLDEAKMEVKVPSFVRELFNKYRDPSKRHIFKFYTLYSTKENFNAAINIGLKQIGQELGIDDLEFYAARHSWATIALNKCKIDKYTVHAALNHVDNSMKVTDIYIDRDFVNENEANIKVLDYVFGDM